MEAHLCIHSYICQSNYKKALTTLSPQRGRFHVKITGLTLDLCVIIFGSLNALAGIFSIFLLLSAQHF